MVKLYYTPTSCGASSFIAAYTGKLSFDCEVVDLATHKTETGVDFYTINPKGNVPCLVLDDGTILNENIACLEYIAYLSNISEVSFERFEILQILSYIASELHATIGTLFNPKSSNSVIREFIITSLDKKMKYLQKNLLDDGNNQYIVGNKFTIADSYLHIVLSWLGYVNVNIDEYPIAKKYFEFICSLDNVKVAKRRMASIPSTTY
jgi:glutathione S-transferase